MFLQVDTTILVKSPWDTRRKSLTQLPVVSYCYQIIVLSTHSLTPSPLSPTLSPEINVELNMYKDFFTNCNIEQGRGAGGGGGWTIFLQGTWNLIIKFGQFWTISWTILSRIVDAIHRRWIRVISIILRIRIRVSDPRWIAFSAHRFSTACFLISSLSPSVG